MNLEMVIFRVLHIIFGVFWTGTAMFMAIILEPRLRALGPTVQRPVMGALAPIMTPVMLASGTITIAAGVYLSLRLRWGHLDQFLDTGWGWAILIGLIASIGAFASGFGIAHHGQRMVRLGAAIQGRPPTPEEAQQLQRTAAMLTRLGRTTAILTVVAVVTMAAARYL